MLWDLDSAALILSYSSMESMDAITFIEAVSMARGQGK